MNVVDWLLEGDPSIRWQVLRDLAGASRRRVEAERRRATRNGWIADLLRRERSGVWGGGLYTPKWVSTTYTLLLLRDLGLPARHPAALRGCRRLVDGDVNVTRSGIVELCITGMLHALCDQSGLQARPLLEIILREQMPDGGWNCRAYQGDTHSSFHTTISVLEGLGSHPAGDRGREFLLRHRLFRSHRTGKVAHPAFTRLAFPPRWHYDILRALDHFRAVDAKRDRRMTDAIGLLRSKRLPDGRWKLEHVWPGREHFALERVGKPSRCNTLRALRVLRWWEGGAE